MKSEAGKMTWIMQKKDLLRSSFLRLLRESVVMWISVDEERNRVDGVCCVQVNIMSRGLGLRDLNPTEVHT